MCKKIQLFTILLFVLAACGPLGEARKAYDNQDYQRALDMAKMQIAKDSSDIAAIVLAGDCYEKLDQFERASRFYEKAITLKPSNNSTKRKLAALYLQHAGQNNMDDREALNLLVKAEKLTPNAFEVLFKRGQTYNRLGYLKRARTDIMHAQKISPDDPRPAKQLARLDKKEERVQLLFKKGRTAYQKKRWITAVKNLSQAAELNKEDAEVVYMAHLAKGRRAYKKGSVSALWDGIAELGFAIELKPAAAEPWFVMAQSYEKKDRNDFTGAIEPYQKVIELAPNSKYAKIAQARIKKLNTTRERREKFFGKKKK